MVCQGREQGGSNGTRLCWIQSLCVGPCGFDSMATDSTAKITAESSSSIVGLLPLPCEGNLYQSSFQWLPDNAQSG